MPVLRRSRIEVEVDAQVQHVVLLTMAELSLRQKKLYKMKRIGTQKRTCFVLTPSRRNDIHRSQSRSCACSTEYAASSTFAMASEIFPKGQNPTAPSASRSKPAN